MHILGDPSRLSSRVPQEVPLAMVEDESRLSELSSAHHKVEDEEERQERRSAETGPSQTGRCELHLDIRTKIKLWFVVQQVCMHFHSIYMKSSLVGAFFGETRSDTKCVVHAWLQSLFRVPDTVCDWPDRLLYPCSLFVSDRRETM